MSRIFIPNNLNRAQLDAFRSIEVELNRLANEKTVITGSGAPTEVNNLQDGSIFYDFTNLNLYVFRLSDSTWNDPNLAATNASNAIASNIYVSGTETINGAVIADGTVTANEIAADSITADKIAANAITADEIAADAVTANKVLMNGPIEFSSTSSGLHWNKTAYGDGSYGGFIGRHVTASGANAIGLDFTSATSSIRMSSGGNLVTQGILLETGVPGTSTDYSTVGTHYFSITSSVGSLLTVVATGGGGGGGSGRASNSNLGGSTGSPTTMVFVNSSGGTIGSTITASGGAGAGNTVSANNYSVAGYPGGNSVHAVGGAGGSSGGGNGSAGTLGSGGGGAGASSNQAQAASFATSNSGTTIADVLTVPSGANRLKIIIRAGGAGGPAGSTGGGPEGTFWYGGGAGGSGFASVTPPSSGSQLFDFEDLAFNSVPWPSVGEMTTTSISGITNLGSGGAGWYYVAIINGGNGTGSAAQFVGMPHYYGGTPTAGGSGSAIWYKMK